MPSKGGWTGKTLRVDLTRGRIATEDTVAKVPATCWAALVSATRCYGTRCLPQTGAFDEANQIVFGVGPLTGTSAPCGGRTSITTIFPMVHPARAGAHGPHGRPLGRRAEVCRVGQRHRRGALAEACVPGDRDDRIELRDAAHLWGNGIYRATTAICEEMGPETQVAAIGQAGENLVRIAVVMNGFSHSAGGIGGVLGAKRLKAIAVKGSGAVRLACTPARVAARSTSTSCRCWGPTTSTSFRARRSLGPSIRTRAAGGRLERDSTGARRGRRSRRASAGRRTSAGWPTAR